MSLRKNISLLILLTLSLASTGQICPKVETYRVPFLFNNEINNTNDSFFYKKAQQLISTYDLDSLFEARRIFNWLKFFDSTKYSEVLLSTDLLKIETLSYNYLKSNILGKWKLKRLESSLPTSPDSLRINDVTLIFSDTLAILYYNDTLIRKTRYVITNKFASPYFKEIFFQLYFLDNKDLWSFLFITNGENYPKDFKIDKINVGLYINEIPDCVNNCPEKVYLKM
jgi:hypothetical protein